MLIDTHAAAAMYRLASKNNMQASPRDSTDILMCLHSFKSQAAVHWLNALMLWA